LSVGVVSAHDFRTGDNVSTAQDEVIDETLYAFGSTINITGEVNGDVICAGQNVNVSGVVHGDVLCAGQTVNISGQVDGDIRLAGQNISITGIVDGNASIVAQTVTSQSEGEIMGDASVAAELVTFGGPVGRDIAVAASNLVIANTIGRNVKANVESLELTSNAVVDGKIEYTSKNEIKQSSNAAVAGEITRSQPENRKQSGASIFGVAIAWFIYIFLAMLFTSMAIALLFPSVLQSTTDRIMKSPWMALLVGLIASFVVPVLLVAIGLTIIGIPLMILLGLIWLVVIMLSGPFTAYYVGRLIFTNNRSVLLTMLVGSVVLLALYFLPFAGFIALVGAYWLGTGMIILELMRRTPKPSYVAVPEQITELQAIESKPKRKNTKSAKKTAAKKTTKTK
jgi:hypothetical protein